MSRQLEQDDEERVKRENKAILQAVHGGLDDAIRSQGGDLLGFSVKLNSGDCLITLRALFAEDSRISFVGSETLASCLRKVVREAHTGQLSWRPDRYA